MNNTTFETESADREPAEQNVEIFCNAIEKTHSEVSRVVYNHFYGGCIPPIEDMMADIEVVIAGIARKYTDPSCPELHFDELCQEGRVKFSGLLDRAYFERKRVRSRAEFFSVFKTCVNNHIKGRVMKFRFTQKRTGLRPPSKDEQLRMVQLGHSIESYKPREIRIDDEEIGFQLEEGGHDAHTEEILIDDMRHLLNPQQWIVFNELHEPGVSTNIFAYIDSCRGKKHGSSTTVTIDNSHRANGLGMSLEMFEQVMAQVQEKLTSYLKEMDTQDQQFTCAVASLAKVFGVEVPPTLAKVVVRRLFTLAARDQANRVTDEVRELLLQVGAKIPETNGVLGCFGVLYKRGHNLCEICSLKEACSRESANFGLGEVVLSKELLSTTKQLRTPALVIREYPPKEDNVPHVEERASLIEDNSLPVTTSVRDGEVLHFLNENFKQVVVDDQHFYTHRERPVAHERSRLIFCVTGRGLFSLRFVKPSETLQNRLSRKKNGNYLSNDTPAQEAIDMINQHATETAQ